MNDNNPVNNKCDIKHAVERNVVINGTYIRVKSIFGNIPIEKALANIAERKLAVSKQNITQ